MAECIAIPGLLDPSTEEMYEPVVQQALKAQVGRRPDSTDLPRIKSDPHETRLELKLMNLDPAYLVSLEAGRIRPELQGKYGSYRPEVLIAMAYTAVSGVPRLRQELSLAVADEIELAEVQATELGYILDIPAPVVPPAIAEVKAA